MPPTEQPEASSSSSAPASGKAKQTRRRQRLSCVECTRRRQKCDRQIPCGLCVSRGIPHLCRWEPLVARPSPQRPPDNAPTTTHQSTIAALSARIALLEETIERQSHLISQSAADRSPSPTNTFSGSTVLPDDWRVAHSLEDGDVPESISRHTSSSTRGSESSNPPTHPASLDNAQYDFDIQNAADKMAQLSIAPSNEYVGVSTAMSALHQLGNIPRFSHSGVASTPLSNPVIPGNNPLSESLRRLVSGLPPRPVCEALVDAYFRERNWMFGISEQWFKGCCQQMWEHLELRCVRDASHAAGGCPRCAREINPHWLLLLFSTLMLAPRRLVGPTAREYFWKAMDLRRLIEDVMLNSPAYSWGPTQSGVHGITLSCIAAALYTCYLADHGRVSDAWKLAGVAIRNAQAMGLHRDPGWEKLEKMDKMEREIRLLSWWYLVTSDRIYSLVLGRPTMASYESFDVKIVPGDRHADGSENPFMHYQQAFIVLNELIGETVTKCLGVHTPTFSTVLEIEGKYHRWLSKIDPSMDWRLPHPPSRNPSWTERAIAYQRNTCGAYWLGGLMNLYRPYALQAWHPSAPTAQSAGHSPPASSQAHSKSRSTSPDDPKSAASSDHGDPPNPRERCIDLATELITLLCDTHDEAVRLDPAPQGPSFIFHFTYFAFDAAVALAGGLAQDPPHPRAKELLKYIDRAVAMLEASRDVNHGFVAGEAGAASRAATVLAALRKLGRWDERFGEGSGKAATGDATSRTGTRAVGEGTFGFAMPYGGSASFPVDPTRFATDVEAGAAAGYSYGSLRPPQGPSSTAIPFLNPAMEVPSPFPSMFAGITRPQNQPTRHQHQHQQQASSSASSGTAEHIRPSFEHATGFGALGAFVGGMAPVEFGVPTQRAGNGVQAQMVVPFDMLQHSDSFEIDWAAFMDAGGWSGTAGGNGYAAGRS